MAQRHYISVSPMMYPRYVDKKKRESWTYADRRTCLTPTQLSSKLPAGPAPSHASAAHDVSPIRWHEKRGASTHDVFFLR